MLNLVTALLVLLLPGIFVSVHARPRHGDGLAFVGSVVVTATAWHLVSFWWLGVFPVGLRALAYGSASIAAIGLACDRGRLIALVRGLHTPRLMTIAFLALAGARLYPTLVIPVAPGADMSMHGYMAWLIASADGVPTSHRPLVPIDDFGSYSAGLPSLGALVAAMTGMELMRSMLIVACLTHLAATAALYLLCRNRLGRWPAFAGAVAMTALAREPQAYFSWGGNPTVLALTLLVAGLAYLEPPNPGMAGLGSAWRTVLPAALCLGASLLAHSVLPFALAFVLPAVMLAWLQSLGRGERRAQVMRWAAAGLLALILVVPYLSSFHPSLAPGEVELIREWQRMPERLPSGPWALMPVAFLKQWSWKLGRPILAVLCAAAAVLVWRGRRPDADDVILAVGSICLVLNAHVWWLPASYALYPDRIVLLLAIPGSRLIGVGVQQLSEAISNRRWPRRLALAIALALVIDTAHHVSVVYWGGLQAVSVTEDDLRVFRWMQARIPATDLIDNNYGDAGIWIPPILGRPVRQPHVNFVYMDDIKAWQAAAEPRWVFVGSRRVYPQDSPFTVASLVQAPDHYRLAFRAGQSAVFEIVHLPK